MSNDPTDAGDEFAMPPPTGAPVQLPPPPKARFYRKWWFWLTVVAAVLVVVVGITADEKSTSNPNTQATEESGILSSGEPATLDGSRKSEMTPDTEPTTEVADAEESMVDDPGPPDVQAGGESEIGEPEASAPSSGFKLRARGDIADLAKDLDDMAIAAAEGGYFRLLGNSLELSFNVGQLQSLVPPVEIAEEWETGLNRVSKRVDAISDSISGDPSTQEILERIDSAAKALARLSSVLDQAPVAGASTVNPGEVADSDYTVEVQLWNLGSNIYGKTSDLDAKKCKGYANATVQKGDTASVMSPSGKVLGTSTYSWILRDGPQRNYGGGPDQTYVGYCTLTARIPVLDSDVYVINYMPDGEFEIAHDRLEDQNWVQTILF